MVRNTLTLCVVLAISSAATSRAAEPDAAAFAAIVKRSVEGYQVAVQAKDAKALGALFTPEAEYVTDDGTVFHGRAAIQAEFAAIQAVRPEGATTIEVTSIRPIAAGVLVEEGTSTFTPAESAPASQSTYAATHVRQADGNWLIASIRELGSPPPLPHEQLKSLGWLLGHWRQESDGTTVDTSWEWSSDGSFLVGRFSSTNADGESQGGTHRIGWDAERGQFRSWIFGADGGSAEGWWTASNGVWSVRLSGTSSTGGRMSTTVHYQRDGSNALVITQDDRSLGGVPLPAFSTRVVRQPSPPARPVTPR